MSRELNREISSNLLTWEKIEQDIPNGRHTYRAKVPGGWLIRLLNTNTHPLDSDHIFIHDAKHTWSKEEKQSE